MSYASASTSQSSTWRDSTAIESPPYVRHQNHPYANEALPHNNGGGKTVGNSLRNNAVLKAGENYRNTQPGTTHSVVVFLTDYFRDTPAKKIARLAGIGIRSAEGIKQGRQTFSMASLERAQRADPDFAAAWAAHVGLLLPGEAEYAGAATRAHHAYERMKAAREASE